MLITVRGTAQVEDVITDLTALPTVRRHFKISLVCIFQIQNLNLLCAKFAASYSTACRTLETQENWCMGASMRLPYGSKTACSTYAKYVQCSTSFTLVFRLPE